MTSEDPPLTRIVANARIATGDPRRPWATALGVQGEILAAVGLAAEILKRAGPATEVLDARGAMVALPPGARVGARIRIAGVGADVNVTLLEDIS